MLRFMSPTLTLFNKRSVSTAIRLLSRAAVNPKGPSPGLVKSWQVLGLLFFQDIPGKEMVMCVYTRIEDANVPENTGMVQHFAFFPFQVGRR